MNRSTALAPLALPLCALLGTPMLHAADTAFELGEVRVSASRPNQPLDPVATTVTSEDMARFNRDTVGQAINLLPGVAVSNNMRNEQTISVRGFDGRRTPLFLDGVPVYVPYDGQVDFSRFLTFDLAEIDVAKGFSSVAYGPNTMGGAINLVTRKPGAAFEGHLLAGVASGGDRKLNANIGTNQGNWYLQVGAAYTEADGFPLSHDFTPTSLENGGQRDNAARRDSKLSAKLGLTPSAGTEYAIGFSEQQGSKGQPPNTNPRATPLNFWRWPAYDKHSLYAIVDQPLSSAEKVKLRLYRDNYAYDLACFTNASYNVGRNCQFGTPVAPTYFLDDTVSGGSFILESTRLSGHVIRAAFHLKTDTHDEHTTGPVTTYRDRTRSYGIEDTIRLTDRLDLALGVSRDEQEALTSGNYGNPTDQQKTNGQAGLFYLLDDGTKVYGTLARKSRFPSIKERFSQTVGTQGGQIPGIANPDLHAETARHIEFGVRTKLSAWSLEAALFHAKVDDAIQSVNFVSGGRTVGQLQNVGRATNRGLEFGARYTVPGLQAGANYTYLSRRNIDTPTLPATDTPRNKLFAFADWAFSSNLRLVASLDAENGRIVATAINRSAYAPIGGFGLVNLKLVQALTPSISLEGGATNLADRNVQVTDGLPLPGRIWFLNLLVKL